MGDQAVAEILRSGVLGALLVLAIIEIRRLQAEVKALLERVIASKETDAAKLREVLGAIGRRYEQDQERRGR